MFTFLVDDYVVIDLSCGFGCCGSPAFYSLAGSVINDLYENTARDGLERGDGYSSGPTAINDRKFTSWNKHEEQGLGTTLGHRCWYGLTYNDKFAKANRTIEEIRSTNHASRMDLHKLLGVLRHIATCFPPARAFYQNVHVPAIASPSFGQRPLETEVCSTGRSVLGFRMVISSIETPGLRVLTYCQLERCGMGNLPETDRSTRELLAVTLNWMTTGSAVRVQEKNFKIAYATCQKYRVLGMKVGISALQHLIRVPTSVSPEFASSLPHFNQALCAIVGVHFQLMVAEEDADRFRSRKGTTSTNVLIASDWNLQVSYVYAGVEGSAHDSSVLSFSGFMRQVPVDYYVLADAGYALTNQVLTPYRGVRYHLKEWCSSGCRPKNPKELFNLKHSPARNVVERLIGVLKRRFRVLRQVNECELEVVKVTVFSCCCVRNFIRQVDSADNGEGFPGESQEDDDEDIIQFDFNTGSTWRDYMAHQMWSEYKRFLGDQNGIRIRAISS
ncbi:hypothetical protein ON010_g1419 [Phytophthora cinnamomi]|nr:hypothetical protein ON010_g1419 [Phytophthora cinnamomi]